MKAAAQALMENPSWSRQSLAWQRAAVWAFGYVEEPVPGRDDIRQALIAAQHTQARPPLHPKLRKLVGSCVR